jgi:hypothetical protein
MKITELLVESQQLDEGPFGQAVGKAVGGVAKGVGAVAGGIAGIPGAVKKGFQAGKAAVQGEPAADTTQAEPAPAAPKKSGGIRGAIDQFKQGFAQGRGEPTATASTNTAAPTQASSAAAPAADPKADAQSKVGVGQINKIIPTLRTRDLMSLKKNLDTVIAKKSAEKPAAKTAAPAADTPINPATGKPLTEPERAAHQAAGGQFDGETGAPLPLGTKAQTPPTDFEKKLTDLKAKRDAEKAAQAKPAAAQTAPTAEPTGTGQAAAAAQAAGQDPEAAAKQAMAANNPKLAAAMQQAGEMPATANKKAAPKKKAAPSQATIDADRERLMGRMSDSIERHKQHMVAEGLANGSIRIFKR